MADARRGSYRGYFRRDWGEAARRLMTHLRHQRCNIAVLHEAALTCQRVW
jgi:hypothetical protein